MAGEDDCERSASAPPLTYCTFRSELGWMALRWQGPLVQQLVFGDASPSAALRRAGLAPENLPPARALTRAMQELVDRLQQYALGAVDAFLDVDVSWDGRTAFQRAVFAQCRRIGYGQVASYGELAARAGHPRSARAVGNVLASNRVPLIVPCHRVVAAGNKLGGFSAPDGVHMKCRLLRLEASSPEYQAHSVCRSQSTRHTPCAVARVPGTLRVP